jgi:hypothetical protein
MKRRTLLALLALVAPVRAAFVSKSTDSSKGQGSENKMNPIDAARAVYDGFTPVEGSEEIVFRVETRFPQNYIQYSCKKIVSLTGTGVPVSELWIVFEEAFSGPTHVDDLIKSGSCAQIRIPRLSGDKERCSGENLKTKLQFSGIRAVSWVGSKCFQVNKTQRSSLTEKNGMNFHEQRVLFEIISRFIHLVS